MCFVRTLLLEIHKMNEDLSHDVQSIGNNLSNLVDNLHLKCLGKSGFYPRWSNM